MNNNLTKRELEVMRVLWKAKNSLKVSEIASIMNRTIDSVQATVKSLFKKNMVEVDDVVHTRNAIARKFKPTVTSDSIEMGIIKNIFHSLVSKDITVTRLTAAFLSENGDKKTLEELEKLEELIKEQKKQLLDEVNEEGKL